MKHNDWLPASIPEWAFLIVMVFLVAFVLFIFWSPLIWPELLKNLD